MDKQYKILILEDKATDVELEIEALNNSGITFTSQVVSTKEDFEREVVASAPDLVISDYTLPQYSGMKAFFYMKEKGLQIPFLMASGTLPQDVAPILEDTGLSALLLKSELSKLPEAVKQLLASKNSQK